MLLRVFCIWDGAAEEFQAPFYNHSIGLVNRALSDEIASGDSPLSKHVDDFSLYELGNYDTQTGRFVLHDSPKLIYALAEIVVN